jgi:hypothetical protein
MQLWENIPKSVTIDRYHPREATMSKLSALALAASATLLALPAHAADCSPSIANGGPTGVPSFSDLTVPGGVTACAGFYTGNGNSGSAADLATVSTLLAGAGWSAYGLSTTGPIEQLNISSGTVNFSTALSGPTLVGVHWGNYGGNSNPAGNVTAFYLFNAGASLDTFAINQTRGLSNVAVWATTPVPEPETYALMLGGLAAGGFMLRRRRVV